MDKPNNGNTITIKLNGEQKVFKEELKEKEVVHQPQPELPAVIEPAYQEAEGTMETAAAQEMVDDFEWIIPESSDMVLEEYEIPGSQVISKKGKVKFAFSSASYQTKAGGSFKSVFFSVIFAILLGTAFGFLMLKVVIPKQSSETASSSAAINSPLESSPSSGKSVSGNGSAVTADIQSITAYVVQGGVFSTGDSAKGTADNLKGQGVPSTIIEISGKDYLFMGVAESIDSARQLAAVYKQKGINDVYAKPLTLEGKKISGLTEAEKSFLESSLTIYLDLSKVTASALMENSISSGSMQNANEQLNKTAHNQLKNKSIKAMNKDLTSAYSKMKTYQTTKESKDLTEAQQDLLSYLSEYYSL